MEINGDAKSPERSFQKARGFCLFNPGNDLVSHKVALAVPSAQRGLTSVFGMGTGVTLSIQSPETFYRFRNSDGGFREQLNLKLSLKSEFRNPKSKNS